MEIYVDARDIGIVHQSYKLIFLDLFQMQLNLLLRINLDVPQVLLAVNCKKMEMTPKNQAIVLHLKKLNLTILYLFCLKLTNPSINIVKLWSLILYLKYLNRVGILYINFQMETYESYSEKDEKSELIFPPLLILKQLEPLCIKGKNCTWYRPITIDHLINLKVLIILFDFLIQNEFSNSKIVCGNTEVGIDVKFRNMKAPTIISVANIPELSKIYINNSNVHFGASASLTSVSEFIKGIYIYLQSHFLYQQLLKLEVCFLAKTQPQFNSN